mmetsp:Transcript_3072/g.8457  ORF Transcript_3072/g.8457 Transcript_3072/m.8457 type:complete len:95 (+) Transcript_3072:758-1042(+)
MVGHRLRSLVTTRRQHPSADFSRKITDRIQKIVAFVATEAGRVETIARCSVTNCARTGYVVGKVGYNTKHKKRWIDFRHYSKGVTDTRCDRLNT